MGETFNAVFKGGGAKGLAYAGAIEACERAGVRFAHAAGSSAGAITATLVACNRSAAEMRALVPAALGAIEAPMDAVLRFRSSSLLRSDALLAWLNETLWDAMDVPHRDGGETPEPVTFGQLFQRFEIGLFVVAMDLASRQPIVFGSTLTPDACVADAVMASSAIPVAFPSVRMVIEDEIHRVVDGGTWANYPAFIFHDDDFRSFHHLEPNELRTIGFILDSDDAVDPVRHRTVDRAKGPPFDTDRGAIHRELGIAGVVLSSPLFRVLLGFTPLLVVLLVVLGVIDQGRSDFEDLARLPDGLETPFVLIIGAVLSIGLPLTLLSGLLVARLGRAITDEGVVGALAAMGVGPSVPYWVGDPATASRHIAVRIRVPNDLSTLAFDASDELAHEAIQRGGIATATALERAGVSQQPSSVPASPGPHPTTAGTELEEVGSSSLSARRLAWWALTWPMQIALWALDRWFGVSRRSGQAAMRWLYAAFGSALLATSTAAGATTLLLDGQPIAGAFVLALSGGSFAFFVWVIARRRSRLGSNLFPIIGRLPGVLRTGIGTVSVGLLVAIVIGAWQMPSVVAVSNAVDTAAVVISVDDDRSQVLVSAPRSEVEVDAFRSEVLSPLPRSAQSAFLELFDDRLDFSPRKDSDGRSIESCSGQGADATSEDVGCWRLPLGSAVIVPGSVVAIRFHEQSGLTLLDGTGPGPFFTLFLSGIFGLYALGSGAFAYQCWRVRVWKRSQQSLR